MSRVDKVVCDACGDPIEHMTHLRLRRFFLHGWVMRVLNWGVVNYSPVSEGWRKKRIDLCDGCWHETKMEVGRRVGEQ